MRKALVLAALLLSLLPAIEVRANIDLDQFQKQYAGAIAKVHDSSFDNYIPDLNADLWVEGRFRCTGFHIGKGIVVTAGHCTGKGTSKKDLKNISFEWGRTEESLRKNEKRQISSVVKLISREVIGNRNDHAIYLVSPVPKVALRFNPKRVPKINEPVFTIGHPYGNPQKISELSTVTDQFKCQNAIDDFWFLFELSAYGVMPGNSGGPILSAIDGTVLGVVNTQATGTALSCVYKK